MALRESELKKWKTAGEPISGKSDGGGLTFALSASGTASSLGEGLRQFRIAHHVRQANGIGPALMGCARRMVVRQAGENARDVGLFFFVANVWRRAFDRRPEHRTILTAMPATRKKWRRDISLPRATC